MKRRYVGRVRRRRKTEPTRRVGLCAAVLLALGTLAAAAPPIITPEQAIRAEVARRLGGDAVVTVTRLETDVQDAPGLEAVPEVTARVGRPARFAMSVGGARKGSAVATVTAIAAYPRAARAISRDEAIGSDALDFSREELPPVAFRALLKAGDIVGMKARRDIAPGEPMTTAALRVPPLVKSGDEVEVTIRIGAVEVTGAGIASGSGQEGDIIRVIQPKRTQLLKARITGRGAVEVVQ